MRVKTGIKNFILLADFDRMIPKQFDLHSFLFDNKSISSFGILQGGSENTEVTP